MRWTACIRGGHALTWHVCPPQVTMYFALMIHLTLVLRNARVRIVTDRNGLAATPGMGNETTDIDAAERSQRTQRRQPARCRLPRSFTECQLS